MKLVEEVGRYEGRESLPCEKKQARRLQLRSCSAEMKRPQPCLCTPRPHHKLHRPSVPLLSAPKARSKERKPFHQDEGLGFRGNHRPGNTLEATGKTRNSQVVLSRLLAVVLFLAKFCHF